jgi:hypothetical protein
MSTRAATMLSGLVRDTGLLGPTDSPRAGVPAVLRAHRARLAGPHAPTLGGLTCPASRLEGLFCALGPGPLRFVLAMDTGAADVGRAVAHAYEDGRAVLIGVEIPTRPDDDQGPRAAKAARALGHLPAGVPGFVEVHPGSGWRDALGLLAARGRGARLRAGGGPAEIRPSATQLAKLIHGCLREAVPFTCSPGGLRAVPEGGTGERPMHHGLLNIVLATTRALDGAAVEDLAAVLAVRDPADLLAELGETPVELVGRARELLRTLGCDDVEATLVDLSGFGLVPKTG